MQSPRMEFLTAIDLLEAGQRTEHQDRHRDDLVVLKDAIMESILHFGKRRFNSFTAPLIHRSLFSVCIDDMQAIGRTLFPVQSIPSIATSSEDEDDK